MLRYAFGDEAISTTQIHDFYKRFKEDWPSTENNECSGRAST